jgi:hypothetical protein
VFVPEQNIKIKTNRINSIFFEILLRQDYFSRIRTGHVNLPSCHGAEESVGCATSPQTLNQRGGRLTSP